MLPRPRAGAASSGALEDLKVRRRPFGNGDDTEGPAASTVRAAAHHLVDPVLAWINRTWQTVTVTTAASDLDAPGRHRVAEWCCSFEVDRVPPKLHKGIARRVRIGACHVRSPVAYRVGVGSPDACFVSGDSWRVDVEANIRQLIITAMVKMDSLLSSGSAPIARVRDGEGRPAVHAGRNEHGFIARQNCLAERDSTASIVRYTDGTSALLAVRLIGERLADLAILVAI